MAKFNEYPVKTTPKDADKFMLYSAEDAANKLIDYDNRVDNFIGINNASNSIAAATYKKKTWTKISIIG